MTAVFTAEKSIVAVQRPECVACCRPYGRRRSPSLVGDALFDCGELIVCDQCWQLAGGGAAVQARIIDNASGRLAPMIEFDPAVEALLASADEYDLLHPIDRLLVESGIRWAVLRTIAVPARTKLAGLVLQSVAPTGTRTADSPHTWLSAVEGRIRDQTGPGLEFRYNAKRRRWWRICNVLRRCSDEKRRPLTWISQEEIAAAVGCSDRTVRRCVAWLQQEGLMWQIVPGCQMPRQDVPDAESVEERAARQRRLAEAVAAENAAIARARAEVRAVHDGLRGQAAAEAALETLSPEFEALLSATAVLDAAGLVQLAPVYELRVPLDALQLADEAAIAKASVSAGEQLVRQHADEVVHPANIQVYRSVTVVYANGAHAEHDPLDLAHLEPSPLCPDCGRIVGYLRRNPLGPDLHIHKNVHPPEVCKENLLKSSTAQPVDNRPATPGSDQEAFLSGVPGSDLLADGSIGVQQGNDRRSGQSEAVRAAEWLLRSRLHPDLADDVSVHWLAGAIRGSSLLSDWGQDVDYGKAGARDAGWNLDVPPAWNELADLLHGVPEYLHLPRFIRDPRAWIKARIQRADKYLPPSKLKIIRRAEGAGLTAEERHADRAGRSRRALGQAMRAAVNACHICDQDGWFLADPTDPAAPVIKCNHDSETGGW